MVPRLVKSLSRSDNRSFRDGCRENHARGVGRSRIGAPFCTSHDDTGEPFTHRRLASRYSARWGIIDGGNNSRCLRFAGSALPLRGTRTVDRCGDDEGRTLYIAPSIRQRSAQIHHDKHHATYIAGINGALEGKDQPPIADLMKTAITGGVKGVRNSGVQSHTLTHDAPRRRRRLQPRLLLESDGAQGRRWRAFCGALCGYR